MAIDKARVERIKAVTDAWWAATDESGHFETIDDIEDEMVSIGDLVTRESGAEKLAADTSRSDASAECRRRGGTGALVGRRTRELVPNKVLPPGDFVF